MIVFIRGNPLVIALFVQCALAGVAPGAQEPYERAPIHYSTTQPNDAVTRLQRRMDAGEATLGAGERLADRVAALLKALDVPVDSQTLVFSKTSLQQGRISPGNPRAIYFNDDTYVAFVPGGRMIEIAATDPRLGSTFYTLGADGGGGKLIRQTDNCLQCHASGMTRNTPGLLVRSVFPDAAGHAILPAGTFLTTHESPLDQRWGGWYVTGSLPAGHMGNRLYDDADPARPKPLPTLDLPQRVELSHYPAPDSDAVALLVLEHQVEAHNRFTRAAHATLAAEQDEQVMAKALGEPLPEGTHSESTQRRVRSACEPLVEYLLFSGEAPLPGPVSGTSSFTETFAARGPRDRAGRSLRQFDLKTRLFKYPCSYLIYSDAFDGLPPVARDYVYRRMYEVLTGKDQSKPFAHLTTADRTVILKILRGTKTGLPAYWGSTAK